MGPSYPAGEVAFEAYAKAVGGTTHDGRVIPDWSALGEEIRLAWELAGRAVIEAFQSPEWSDDGA